MNIDQKIIEIIEKPSEISEKILRKTKELNAEGYELKAISQIEYSKDFLQQAILVFTKKE